MDKEYIVISMRHADSATGYAYVSVIDENTMIYTKNISDATIFPSHEVAYDFIDEWKLKGFHTVDSMRPI